MAVDKLVDSTQLDADLTSVANAIRTKGGTSADLAFPAGFVSAINAISGGAPVTLLNQETITPASNYTNSNKLSVQLTATANYIIVAYASTELTNPDSGTIFLAGYRGKLYSLTTSSGAVLRSAGTVGSDANWGSFNESTGVLQIPNSNYSSLVAGETYEIWQLGM